MQKYELEEHDIEELRFILHAREMKIMNASDAVANIIQDWKGGKKSLEEIKKSLDEDETKRNQMIRLLGKMERFARGGVPFN